MKTLFYTIIVLIGITSCTSVQKMLDKGEYDKAFNYAINKLQGETKKKTQYVKALETAYAKWELNTLRQINSLRTTDKPENWQRALTLYSNLESRQNRLIPLLPLISEDGYEASFDIKNYGSAIKEAEQMTCDYYYDTATELLALASETGDRKYARQAYEELDEIRKFKANYKDVKDLMAKALALGTTKVYIDILDRITNGQSAEVEKFLWQMPISSLDDFWTDYSIGGFDGGKNADYVVIVSLDNLDFSPERESNNRYYEDKEILIRKDKVREKRDTVWVEVEKEVWQKVGVEIVEVYREKIGTLQGSIKLFDNKDKEYIHNIPINIAENFKGYGCKAVGDERALTEESKRKLDNFLEMWPSDRDMTANMQSALQKVILAETKKMRI